MTLGIVAIALVAGACTGTAATTTTTPSTTTTTSTSTTSPSTTTTTTPPNTPTTVPTSFEAEVGTPPAELSSFAAEVEVEIAVGGLTISVKSDGVYTEDAYRCDTEIAFGGAALPISVIVTPSRVWIDRGTGYEETTMDDNDVQNAIGSCAASPGYWTDFADTELDARGEPDELNGVPVERFELDEFLGAAARFGFGPENAEGMTFDRMTMWIADPGGWIAGMRMEMSFDAETGTAIFGSPFDPTTDASGTMSFQVQITDPNNPTLVVEIPQD